MFTGYKAALSDNILFQKRVSVFHFTSGDGMVRQSRKRFFNYQVIRVSSVGPEGLNLPYFID